MLAAFLILQIRLKIKGTFYLLTKRTIKINEYVFLCPMKMILYNIPSYTPSSLCICCFASSLSLCNAILAISKWQIIFSPILDFTKDPVMKKKYYEQSANTRIMKNIRKSNLVCSFNKIDLMYD